MFLGAWHALQRDLPHQLATRHAALSQSPVWPSGPNLCSERGTIEDRPDSAGKFLFPFPFRISAIWFFSPPLHSRTGRANCGREGGGAAGVVTEAPVQCSTSPFKFRVHFSRLQQNKKTPHLRLTPTAHAMSRPSPPHQVRRKPQSLSARDFPNRLFLKPFCFPLAVKERSKRSREKVATKYYHMQPAYWVSSPCMPLAAYSLWKASAASVPTWSQ